MSDPRPVETSVIIRAFNEERWMPEVLDAIARQRYRDFEVILVDSGSVDRTREIASAHGVRIVHLRPDDFTFGHSLNVGIREARGSLVVILSAHAIPTGEDWLGHLVAPFGDERVAMVFGAQRGHAISKFSEARDFERVFPKNPLEMDDEHVFVNNANSAIRRELWTQHAFDEALPGLEDAEWAIHWIQQGKSVRYEPAACIFHVHTESWGQVRHRFHREGIAGRWTKVRLIRNIPGEIVREVAWSVADLASALRQGRLRELGEEIVRYRFNKTFGIVKGILDSRNLLNPLTRAALYFEQAYSAVTIRGPHRAVLEQRPIPALKPGEVLVRVAYEGICATDLEIYEGRLGYYKSGMAKYPIVPGHESSGTVVSIGSNVSQFKQGDRVVVECIQGCGACEDCRRDSAITCRGRREVGVIGIDGGYAAYLVTQGRYVHHVPAGVTLAQAALAEPLAVVMKGLRRLAGTTPSTVSRRCAVLGAGTIGHLAAIVLEQRGHAVTVIDSEESRLALLGGTITTTTSLTGLDSFEWIVEATGNVTVLGAVLDQSATGATLLLLGLPYASQAFSFETIVGFDKSIIGSVGSSGADFDDALLTLPHIDTSAFLGTSFPLEEFERAWDAVRGREHIKVMLSMDPTAR